MVIVNNNLNSEHMWTMARYKSVLTKGQEYTLNFDSNTFWGMNVEITIYSSPFMFSGSKVAEVIGTDSITFVAKRSSIHIFVLKTQSSGFYDIGISETSLGSSNEFESISSPTYGEFIKLVLLTFIVCGLTILQ